jgi:hypothetical protein
MGKGSGSAMMIVAAVIYFTLMSQLALALDFQPTALANFSNSLASIDLGILSFLFDIAAWVISSAGTFFCMIAFSITGDIPLWVGAFFFAPVGMGVGWLVLDLVRG